MKLATGFIFILTLIIGQVYAQSNSVDKFIEEGIQLYDKGDFAGALARYREALNMDEMSPLANYEIALTYIALKDYEKAIAHCENVIKGESTFIDRAYVIYGSALDLKGEPRKAINLYTKAINEFPENHLLHYNLAYTCYNLKDYKQAEDAVIKSLLINPGHASSHLLLGYVMDAQGSRIKTLLPLYNFLLLEPEGQRAKAAHELLISMLQKGVKIDSDNSTAIALENNGEQDEFRAADLMISLLNVSNNTEENKKKSERELFYENTRSFFTILGELKQDNKGFWWNFYVDFYYAMARDSTNVETFSYYISQTNGDEKVREWLANNKDRYERFSKWFSEFERKD